MGHKNIKLKTTEKINEDPQLKNKNRSPKKQFLSIMIHQLFILLSVQIIQFYCLQDP